MEIYESVKFFVDYARGKPNTQSGSKKADFDQAFGIEGSGKYAADISAKDDPSPIRQRTSYDDEIHLASYPYSSARTDESRSPIVK